MAGTVIAAKNVEICGAWMPKAQEHCARRAGHAKDPRRWKNSAHRTRYAMDCQANRWDQPAGLRRRLGLAAA